MPKVYMVLFSESEGADWVAGVYSEQAKAEQLIRAQGDRARWFYWLEYGVDTMPFAPIGEPSMSGRSSEDK